LWQLCTLAKRAVPRPPLAAQRLIIYQAWRYIIMYIAVWN